MANVKVWTDKSLTNLFRLFKEKFGEFSLDEKTFHQYETWTFGKSGVLRPEHVDSFNFILERVRTYNLKNSLNAPTSYGALLYQFNYVKTDANFKSADREKVNTNRLAAYRAGLISMTTICELEAKSNQKKIEQ